MNTDEFWGIVDRVHAGSPDNMDAKCRGLERELRELSVNELHSFDQHFCKFWHEADTWNLWGAAVVICGGCSDDSFMDFRATLISVGRSVFETALADADSLAGFDIDPAWAQYEGYQYVACHIYEELVGRAIPHWNTYSRETTGVPFNVWELSKRLPKLARKHGFKDSDWDGERIRAEREAKKNEKVEQIVAVALRGGIIPPCGLIPPMQVLANVLRVGHSPELTGHDYTWSPFELDEEHYWSTVNRLERMKPEELVFRSDLHAVRLTLDLGAKGVLDFPGWIESLKCRGEWG